MSTEASPTNIMPLELVDKCVGSKMWIILKSRKEFVGTLLGFDDYTWSLMMWLNSKIIPYGIIIIFSDELADGTYKIEHVGRLLLNSNTVCMFVPGGKGPVTKLMPFLLLPEVTSTTTVDWNLRFLSKCADKIKSTDHTFTPPTLQLMELLKDGFVDGCSMTLFDPHARRTNPIGTRSIFDFLCDTINQDPNRAEHEIMALDYSSSICYLVMPIANIPGCSRLHRMILWRLEKIFTPNDVVTTRLLIGLLKNTFQRLDSSSPTAPLSLPSDGNPRVGKALRTALDTINDCILICTHNGTIVDTNKAAESRFRPILNQLGNFEGNAWLVKVCHPDDLKGLFEAFSNTDRDRIPREIKCRLLSLSGNYSLSILQIDKVYDAQGSCFWTIVITSVDTNASTNGSIDNLKNRFLAEISHEIRTPLACILGTSTLLSHTKLDNDQEEMIRTITISSQQLSNLITNVLDLTKIEENKLIPERTLVLVEKCAFEVLELFRTDFTKMKIEPILDISVDVPKWIITDELRVRQVLTNLLNNSIKFSKQNSAIILGIRNVVNDSVQMLEFRVEDEGIGIPESAGKSLFQSFNQADVSITRRFGGSGLGLVICKKLVSLLGGSIWFTSTPGVGSIFRFTIPIEEPVDLQISTTEPSYVSTNDFILQIQDIINGLSLKKDLDVPIAFTHCKVSSHYLLLFEKITKVAPFIARHEDYFRADSSGSILLTDDPLRVESFNRNIKDPMKAAIMFVSYISPQALSELKNLFWIRKPLRDNAILEVFKSLLQKCFNISSASSSSLSLSLSTPSSYPSKKQEVGDIVDIARSNPLRILIAEDDLLNQRLLSKTLAKFGYTNVITANDGVEAIEEIRGTSGNPNGKFDVVFMDMQMPNLDGCKASEQLRREGSKIHIVAMTANAFNEDRDYCLKSGMCDYASKPVSWESLQDILVKTFKIASGEIKCQCQGID